MTFITTYSVIIVTIYKTDQQRINNKIKTKRRKVVVYMGCGKAHISVYFNDDNRFEFINYDHIAANDKAMECDISNMPLEDDSVELCILSLAMWGSNCREYIMEANRVLANETMTRQAILSTDKNASN